MPNTEDLVLLRDQDMEIRAPSRGSRRTSAEMEKNQMLPLGCVDRLHVIEGDQCELSDLLDGHLRVSFCLVDIGDNVVARGSPLRGHVGRVWDVMSFLIVYLRKYRHHEIAISGKEKENKMSFAGFAFWQCCSVHARDRPRASG